MPHYDVTIERTERITLRVEADNAEHADEIALHGDEIASKTTGQPTTISIELADAEGEYE